MTTLDDVLMENVREEIEVYLNAPESPEEILANLVQYVGLSYEEAKELVEKKFGCIDHELVCRYLGGDEDE